MCTAHIFKLLIMCEARNMCSAHIFKVTYMRLSIIRLRRKNLSFSASFVRLALLIRKICTVNFIGALTENRNFRWRIFYYLQAFAKSFAPAFCNSYFKADNGWKATLSRWRTAAPVSLSLLTYTK